MIPPKEKPRFLSKPLFERLTDARHTAEDWADYKVPDYRKPTIEVDIAMHWDWHYWYALRMGVQGNPLYEDIEKDVVDICDERLSICMTVFMLDGRRPGSR